jgi:putative MATE family efflux protein
MQKKKQNIQGRGIEILTGNPKKAIIRLAIPMAVAMSVQTLYNLADAIWVSGMGADALAAVGFYFPFNMFLIALSTRIAIGAGSAISRAIGAKNKQGATQIAIHGLYMAIITGIIFTIFFTLSSRLIFKHMGAGETLNFAVQYGRIMFAGSIFTFFQSLASNYLRSEGDANRSMNVMILGAVMNIILDPLFIYTYKIRITADIVFSLGLNWGVVGAAIATVLSIFLSSIPLFYWLFIKKDTYINFSFKGFRLKKEIILNILNGGIPASLSQVSMSIMMFFITLLITRVNDTNGVAIFTAGWRVVMLAIMPLLGISTAVIAVCAAAYGAKDYDKLYTAYTYSIKVSVLVMFVISSFTYILAPYISMIFTWSEASSDILPGLINMNRILCFYYPFVPLGMHTASMFQGIRKGFISLVITIIRTLLLALPFAALLALLFKLNLEGIWIGLALGNSMAGIISITWGLLYIKHIKVLNEINKNNESRKIADN